MLGSWGAPGGTCGVLVWWVFIGALVGAHGGWVWCWVPGVLLWVLVGCLFSRCSWVLIGACLVQDGVLMGAHSGWAQHWVFGVLQGVLVGCSFSVRWGCLWVLVVDGCNIEFLGCSRGCSWGAHLVCNGASFSQGQVVQPRWRWGRGEWWGWKGKHHVELLNKPSHVQGISTSCQMQPFSIWQGT